MMTRPTARRGFRGPGNFDDGASDFRVKKCRLCGDAWHDATDCPQSFRTGPGNFDAGHLGDQF